MADDKRGTAAVLTGSTGQAYQDMTPRTAWVSLLTAGASFTCVILGADATVTALSGTLSASMAVLSLCVFDAVIRPRL